MREDDVLVADAATELNVSRHAIWKAIKRGHLQTRRIGPLHVIPREQLDAYKLEHHRPPGRPRKGTAPAK